ncbi:MAG: biopolymer transporter ExbD [Deltaproteobacteria bacterium]|nr:biopolymer transporter ExbD [Deltaproteobacteria bacterium]
MGMSSGGTGRAMSEINVTPLVDVMLVLLIIFMVTAPLIQQGVKVDLPEVKAPTMDVKDDRVVLTLTKEQRIYIGKTEIPYRQLKDKLTGNLKLQKDKEIFLHADRALPYGFVVDIMAIVKEAGVEQMGMVTDPLTEGSR